jgi:hypothetical protein
MQSPTPMLGPARRAWQQLPAWELRARGERVIKTAVVLVGLVVEWVVRPEARDSGSVGTAVTGFPPGTITGTQHAGNSSAAKGKADLTIAYNDAARRALCAVTVAGNLGGQTLTPGLYKSSSSLEVSSISRSTPGAAYFPSNLNETFTFAR